MLECRYLDNVCSRVLCDTAAEQEGLAWKPDASWQAKGAQQGTPVRHKKLTEVVKLGKWESSLWQAGKKLQTRIILRNAEFTNV